MEKELYKKKLLINKDEANYLPPETGVKLVGKGGFAFHVELDKAYRIIEHFFTDNEICELEKVTMLHTQVGFVALQKQSPFYDVINFW